MKKLLLALILIPAVSLAATLSVPAPTPVLAAPTVKAATPTKTVYPKEVGKVVINISQFSDGGYVCSVNVVPAPVAGTYPSGVARLQICDYVSVFFPQMTQ